MNYLKDNLKGKTVWAYCENCHTMNKDPPMWSRPCREGEIPVYQYYECRFCGSWCSEAIIVPEGEDPPKWWIDKVMGERRRK